VSELRLAHISDLHVPARWPRAPWLYLGKRAIGAANWKLRREGQHPRAALEALVREIAADRSIDHLVITGDLTNVSFPSEFEAAREVLRPLIEREPGFVSVVPGNHDRYTYASQRARTFERVFADCITSELDTGARYPFVRFRKGAAVIGLDSAIATPLFFATGELGAAQRERLARVLEDPRVRGATFRVVLIHHPPLTATGERDRPLHRLTDDRELLELAQRARVDLLLTGHIHDAFAIERIHEGRTLRGIGVGSSTRVQDRAEKLGRWNVYTIGEGSLLSVETRVFDPASGSYSRTSESA
jgi:3',5'-cyclic AMP phosphodiesterase CpdA